MSASAGGSPRSSRTAAAHASGRFGRQQPARDPVLDQLGPGAGVAHERRRAERHALDRHEPERLLLGGQQRQVERPHHLGHVVALAEEVHRIADPQLVDQSSSSRR